MPKFSFQPRGPATTTTTTNFAQVEWLAGGVEGEVECEVELEGLNGGFLVLWGGGGRKNIGGLLITPQTMLLH